jgi:hypothetical protein
MPKLSSNQLQEYNDNSHVAPIKVLTKDQTYEVRKKLIPTCKKNLSKFYKKRKFLVFLKKNMLFSYIDQIINI